MWRPPDPPRTVATAVALTWLGVVLSGAACVLSILDARAQHLPPGVEASPDLGIGSTLGAVPEIPMGGFWAVTAAAALLWARRARRGSNQARVRLVVLMCLFAPLAGFNGSGRTLTDTVPLGETARYVMLGLEALLPLLAAVIVVLLLVPPSNRFFRRADRRGPTPQEG